MMLTTPRQLYDDIWIRFVLRDMERDILRDTILPIKKWSKPVLRGLLPLVLGGSVRKFPLQLPLEVWLARYAPLLHHQWLEM